MKLSIIIPVYNEENSIQEIISKVKEVRLVGIQKDIIIVDDGSVDGTRKILQRYINDSEIKIYFLENNCGKTEALVFGIARSIGDIVLVQDADLEYNPVEYPKLLEPIVSGRADVVYGSRFKGSIKNMLFINRLANLISNLIFTLLYFYPVTDINTCFKVFRRKVISGIVIKSKNFEFETEVTAKVIKQGYKIFEIPVKYCARSRQEGKKICWKRAVEMFWCIIKYRFIN
jgi:glycosyltransferase involved in cell wall biosynthesis